MSSPPSQVNYWPESRCARAFWGQRELPPYRQLLTDTVAWIDPRPGQRWLDLGCGGGQLSRAVWEKSGGSVAEVVALDVAAANEKAIAKLRGHMNPSAPPEKFRFHTADFSAGLASYPTGHFDGVVSGLAIQYAESYDHERKRWTTDAYDRLLADVCRVLKPGGVFVFSVNVPNPSWGKVALYAVHGAFRSGHPFRYAKNAWRMWWYGTWLKREARRGRFHYLPVETVRDKMTAGGFGTLESRLSFAGQAYIVRGRRPVVAEKAA